ncbi:MAG: sensor histidine kinase [Caldilineaceae bacterium]|nr:sensor histidine kinase [Caldilineaceae bacterium]
MMNLQIQDHETEATEPLAEPNIVPVDESSLDEVALFSVDSMLLRELGERLVGKPHIALAELVKNSYDADATEVLIRFTPDQIEIIDNGHGMDLGEFQRFWMRVGSAHKEKQRVSRDLNRPMTGSKGVGRLAVQFLARRLSLRTVSNKDLNSELAVAVNWDEAIRAGDLTQARAKYEVQSAQSRFTDSKRHGTALVLSRINQDWGAKDFRELAGEIWWLQPPFRPSSRSKSDQKNSFSIRLENPVQPKAVQQFDEQMTAILDIWTARLQGRVKTKENGKRVVELILEFAEDAEIITHSYPVQACAPQFVEFEIRIYNLLGRQPKGILVQDARQYFEEFGGVHVYDAGFHLPYYGQAQDWVRIELDHSARQWQSRLLPADLQVVGGLRDLPTTRRIFGVVHVDTSYEINRFNQKHEDEGCPTLQIQVTRDRLLENRAYDDLVHLVRYSLDFYAMQQARRKLLQVEQQQIIAQPREKFENVDRALQEIRYALPEPVYEKFRTDVKEAIEASEFETTLYQHRTGLLGALATAGMSALAIEHEVQKQYTILETVSHDLRMLQLQDSTAIHRLQDIADRIEEWIRRARATRAIFSHLLDEEDRESRARFRAKPLLRDTVDQIRVLLRGTQVHLDHIDPELRLPHGGFAEWNAIFQNVLVNAVNAMLDSQLREIEISSREQGKVREILVQDTGVGVDLTTADELFEPFQRRLELSEERKALGVGGTGLGLTIVRMIAESLGCSVKFTQPTDGHSTAFSLSWRES